MFDAPRKELIVAMVCCAALEAGFTVAQEPPLTDPMRPFSTERAAQRAAVAARPRVSAILISSSRRVAVIDGRAYREGDVFSGAEITRIEARAVHLRRGNDNLVMPLAEPASSATN